MYIDTHCHIDMFKNPKEVLNNCENKKILTIGMTNLPSHFEMGIIHVKNCKYVRLALGMHPLMANKHAYEFIKFKRNVNKSSYIGEVGLDYSIEGINTKEKQIESFEFVLNEIAGKKKIVSLHSRKSEADVLHYLKKYNIETAIFHWYSGSLTNLESIVENGYFFSINTAMIKSKIGQKIISRIPPNRILTETDAPYILIGDKPAEPEDVKLVIKYLANVYQKSETETSQMVYKNFKSIIDSIR